MVHRSIPGGRRLQEIMKKHPRRLLRNLVWSFLLPSLWVGLGACSTGPKLASLPESSQPELSQAESSQSESQPAGEFLQTINHGGVERTYLVHVPKSYSGGGVPLVVVLHGAFNDGAGIARDSGFSELSDEKGFLVAYPQGIGLKGKLRHWNGGFCCGKAVKEEVDDVGFVAAVLADLGARFEINSQKVYLVGMSNGGMLAYRYAAERTEEIAGLAVVSGSLGGRSPSGEHWQVPAPKAAMPLVVVHGVDDERIPFSGPPLADGGAEIGAVSAEESTDFFVRANQCAPQPEEEVFAGGRVSRKTWTACSQGSNVVLFAVKDWGHEWPGGPRAAKAGGFDAAQEIWNQLRQARRWRLFDQG